MSQDLLAAGLAWLTGQLAANASTLVTYVQGSIVIDNVPSMFGNKLLKLADDFGNIHLEWTDLDHCIASVYLTVNGVILTPTRGDLIYVTSGNQNEVQVYEVNPISDKEPAWRWADPHQTMYRIHTKWITTEPSGY